MMFGDRTDEAEAARIVAASREAGLNAIDTADIYAGGESERITGRLIAAERGHWVLATKLANPTGPGPNDRGLSRRHMLRRGGCQPAAPGHRLDRPAVHAPRRREHADGRSGGDDGAG